MKHSSDSKYDPWTDEDCIEAFIESRNDDFDYWLSNKGYDPMSEKKSNYYLSYCEEHENKFLNFAFNFNDR